MASFSAELRVAGHAFPVLLCTFGVGQTTHQRGRVGANDKSLGFPGAIKYFQDPGLRWQTEYNAYMEEVKIARQVRRFDIGHDLVDNARNEKQYLIDNFNLGN